MGYVVLSGKIQVDRQDTHFFTCRSVDLDLGVVLVLIHRRFYVMYLEFIAAVEH